MANNTANPGFDLAMDIVEAFPPMFWKKWNYENEHFVLETLSYGNIEFYDINLHIQEAQSKNFIEYNNHIESIIRIQYPYTYARYMLKKRSFEMKYGRINQVRKYLLIHKEYIELAIKYNCDARRLGAPSNEQIFTSVLPIIPNNCAVLVVKILTTDQDDGYSSFNCANEADFYVEYVVYFA